MKIKREHLILIFILLIGSLIRVHLFIGEIFPRADAVYYSHLGKNLIESGRYAYGENFNFGIFLPPGYPFFIGVTNLFFDDLFFSTKIVSLIASLITIFLFYITGKKLYNEEAGLFAAFMYAVHPLILRLSVFGNSESLFLCVLFLSFYVFMVSIKRDNLFMQVLAGAFFAAAYLIKPEGLLTLLLPFLYIFGLCGDKPPVNKRLLLKLCLVILTFALLVSPYLIFLKNQTGGFTLTGKGNVNLMIAEKGGGEDIGKLVGVSGSVYDRIAFSLNERKDNVVGFDMSAKESFVGYIVKDPLNLLKRYQKNVLNEIRMIMKLIFPILLPLFFVFINKELFQNKMRFIFLLYALLFFAAFPLIYIVEKHMSVIVSFLIVFSAGGFVNSKSAVLDIAEFYNIGKNKFTLFFANNIKHIIIVVSILSSLSYLAFSNVGNLPVPFEHKKAGLFLKNNVSPEYEKLNVMASLLPYVNFYSGARFTMIPYANVHDVIDFAKLYDVDYIVVDERSLSDREFYDELVKADTYSDEVELVYEDSSLKSIKLFKINK